VNGKWLWLGVLCLLGLSCGGPAQTTVDLQKQALDLNDAGYQYYRESRFNVARGKFEQALKFNRLIDRREGIAANLNNLGVIAQEQGDPEQATRYFDEALAINRERKNTSGTSETLNNLGLAYQTQGRLREAQEAYQEAWDLARTLPPGPLWALSLTHLGDIARVRGEYALALNYYHLALRADEGQKDQRGRATRWERLGRTFVDLKDYDRARTYLNDALREFRRQQDTNGIADTLKDLTMLALAQGDRQEARLNGNLLLEIYQARGQEKEAEKLEALLKRGVGVKGQSP
jgi:tetratricopeptide (TPR) repeat protein